MLAVLMLVAPFAHAAQVVDVRDGDTAVVRISVRDQTRVRVERGRITDVMGNLFQAESNPGGRINVLKDEVDGEIYLQPMPAADVQGGRGGEPVKLDIKTDRGTFALLVQPADVVGDTLVLRPRSGEGAPPKVPTQAQRSGAHVRSIKALILAMANPALGAEFDQQRVGVAGEEQQLWAEARLVLKQITRAPGLRGDSFELTNVSGQRLVLDERELFSPGVLAVSAKRLVLEPGESTPLWVVRSEE
ncbi:MAG: hypothetical protein C4K60_20335 [Ideonella sp. MAG2]|nr:MAG: hypothetical protein C4K60_20335 [Ideonella sp. MAG2]